MAFFFFLVLLSTFKIYLEYEFKGIIGGRELAIFVSEGCIYICYESNIGLLIPLDLSSKQLKSSETVYH